MTLFVVTVTAYAEWDVQNKFYFGFYNATKNAYGFVKVSEDGVKVGTYEYMENAYISGRGTDGVISSTRYAFILSSAYIGDASGGLTTDTLKNLTIGGLAKIKGSSFWGVPKEIRLTPDGITDEQYVLEK